MTTGDLAAVDANTKQYFHITTGLKYFREGYNASSKSAISAFLDFSLSNIIYSNFIYKALSKKLRFSIYFA